MTVYVVVVLLLIMVYLWYDQKQEYDAVKNKLGAKSGQLIDLVNTLRARDADLASSVMLVEQKTEELRVLMERYKKLEDDNKAQSEVLSWARKALFDADDYILAHYLGENKEVIAKLHRLRDILLVVATHYKGMLCTAAKDPTLSNRIDLITSMSPKELAGDIPEVYAVTTQTATGGNDIAPLLACPDDTQIQNGYWKYYPVQGQNGKDAAGPLYSLKTSCFGKQNCQLGFMNVETRDTSTGVNNAWDISYTCSLSKQQQLLYNEYRTKLELYKLYQELSQTCRIGAIEEKMSMLRQNAFMHANMFGNKQNVLDFIDALEPLLLNMRAVNCENNLIIVDRIRTIYNNLINLLCTDDPVMRGLVSKPLDMVLAKSANMFLG